MSLLNILRRMFKTRKHQPEDDYTTTITNSYVEVTHPKWNGGKVLRSDLHTILLVNTDEGPWLPDVWLTLIGTTSVCRIPQGSKGYEEVYAIVSNYEGFNFENVIKSMSCTDSAEFLLWCKSYKAPERHETIIIGSWTFLDGKMLADENCKRIEWLVKNCLLKISTSNDGWYTIYKDPHDSRYWKLSYSQSEMQGGGPPMLECTSV
jgi:hypothetical protein